jgi:hypothetical protein
MPCFLLVLAMAAPRFVMALLYFFSRWFDGLFPSALWPVLGFIFMPTTLLWWTAVQRWWGGQWTLWPIVGMVIAISIDGSPFGGRGRGRSRTTDE